MSLPHKTRLRGWPDMANVVLGAWLFLSPFILGHEDEMTASNNAYIVGCLLMVMAGYARQEFHLAEELIVAVAACWLIASPWTLGFAETAPAGAVNALATGLAAFALAACSTLMERTQRAPVRKAKARAAA